MLCVFYFCKKWLLQPLGTESQVGRKRLGIPGSPCWGCSVLLCRASLSWQRPLQLCGRWGCTAPQRQCQTFSVAPEPPELRVSTRPGGSRASLAGLVVYFLAVLGIEPRAHACQASAPSLSHSQGPSGACEATEGPGLLLLRVSIRQGEPGSSATFTGPQLLAAAQGSVLGDFSG